MPKTTPDVMSAEEAAEFLGVTAATVRKQAREGRLPGRKIGREWRFSREALLRWLEGADSGDDYLSADDLAAIRRGLEDIKAGRVVPWEQLRTELQR